MSKDRNRVCPLERAGSLDTITRRWMQNPRRLLRQYVSKGMTVLDVGCGPGFFSIALADMIGSSGKVIAADLQQGMLNIVQQKIKGTDLEKRIQLHRCDNHIIGVTEYVDFILAFYVIHELPDQNNFFKEMYSILKPNGQMYIVEPIFHVSRNGMNKTIDLAENKGFKLMKKPLIWLSRSAILKKF
ncbi:MAG: class I SAM-dependent methyltransferase [Calditrichaceae bacterium]